MKKPDAFIAELDKLLFVSPQPYMDPYRVREDAIALFNSISVSSLTPFRVEIRMKFSFQFS